jgi:uncharacterized protein YecE (DUF72 family)
MWIAKVHEINYLLLMVMTIAIEVRHPSWRTEGPWEMLRHYNIAAVMTDSPTRENLQFLFIMTWSESIHYTD